MENWTKRVLKITSDNKYYVLPSTYALTLKWGSHCGIQDRIQAKKSSLSGPNS
jgi:hypothetical protein